MRRAAVPTFDLYADPRSYAVPGFLHAERIRTRARVHDWSIKRHRHEKMWQAMLITGGGGEASVEGETIAITPPWFLWLPAGLVHGFDFLPDTEGCVVTASRDLLDAALAREGFAPLAFLRERLVVAALHTGAPATIDLAGTMDAILAEHGYAGLGARAAVSALFDLVLVAAARIAGPVVEAAAPAEDAALLFRFRGLVESSLREQWPLTRYAAALGVTPDQLYESVRRAAGRSPQTILHDRLLIEAKRGLLYTSMSVGEIAYDLGFEDPAYFTRFFARRAGCPPSLFRRLEGRIDQPDPGLDAAAAGPGERGAIPAEPAPVRGAVAEKSG